MSGAADKFVVISADTERALLQHCH